MRLFKHIFNLMSVITLTFVISCKEKVSPEPEKSFIENLLEQQEPALSTDVHYNYARDKRFLILKTGLDPREIEENPYFADNDGYGFSYLFEKEDGSFVPSDTIGLLQSVEVLRKNLTVSGKDRVFFNHYEVLAIEDVLSIKSLDSNLKYQCITNKLNVGLYSPDQLQAFIRYAESLPYKSIGKI